MTKMDYSTLRKQNKALMEYNTRMYNEMSKKIMNEKTEKLMYKSKLEEYAKKRGKEMILL